MLRNSVASLKFTDDNESARGFVFMQNHQLNTFVRAWLPGFVFC